MQTKYFHSQNSYENINLDLMDFIITYVLFGS